MILSDQCAEAPSPRTVRVAKIAGVDYSTPADWARTALVDVKRPKCRREDYEWAAKQTHLIEVVADLGRLAEPSELTIAEQRDRAERLAVFARNQAHAATSPHRVWEFRRADEIEDQIATYMAARFVKTKNAAAEAAFKAPVPPRPDNASTR